MVVPENDSFGQVWRRLRSRSTSALDRVPGARLVAPQVAARLLGPGLEPSIRDEAISGAADRELKRTLEMLKWAQAVHVGGGFPRWFPAAHHVTTQVGRSSSAVALRSYLGQHPDAGEFLWRQLFAFESNSDLTELRRFVSADLRRRLAARPPADAPGVERRDPPSVALLNDVVPALVGLGCRPFLVSGTLLGYARCGEILGHDYDIDLGLLPDGHEPQRIARCLSDLGYAVNADSRKIVCRTKGGAVVDIFLHYERDGLLWHGTDIHEWWNSPFGLQRVEFMGTQVWVPDDVEAYLNENYGDWSKPVAFYNFSFDTPNRVYRRTPEALLYLHKRLVRALEHADRWSAESVARELRSCFGVDLSASFNATPLLDAVDTIPEEMQWDQQASR